MEASLYLWNTSTHYMVSLPPTPTAKIELNNDFTAGKHRVQSGLVTIR